MATVIRYLTVSFSESAAIIFQEKKTVKIHWPKRNLDDKVLSFVSLHDVVTCDVSRGERLQTMSGQYSVILSETRQRNKEQRSSLQLLKQNLAYNIWKIYPVFDARTFLNNVTNRNWKTCSLFLGYDLLAKRTNLLNLNAHWLATFDARFSLAVQLSDLAGLITNHTCQIGQLRCCISQV